MSDLNPYEEGLALELKAAQDRTAALTEQLAAARQDAKEAEAYAEELEADRKKTYDALLKVTRIHDEVEAKLAKAVKLIEAWGDVAVHCSIEEGVCCCGDNMENHTNPMDCGHTPLDHGTYVVIQLAEETRATLAEIKGESHD